MRHFRYEFNGRQLKVHFDKFAPPVLTALPAVHPLSAPQSPHLHGGLQSMHLSSPLGQGFNLAQQLLMQHGQSRQYSDRTVTGQSQDPSFSSLPFSLQRSLTDTYAHRLPQSSEESPRFAPNVQATGLEPPSTLSRAKSDTIQQLLQSQHQYPSLLPPSSSRFTSGQHYQQPQEEQPLHISLPPNRPPYAFDFSPGSPYDFYHMGPHVSRTEMDPAMSPPTYDVTGATPVDSLAYPSAAYTEPTAPTSLLSSNLAPERQKQTSSDSQSGAYPSLGSSPHSSQTSTNVMPPVTTSPTSAQSGSLHAHPAHPGHISLPPPPSVTAFPIPPAHTLSPYHPPLSPYGPPMHHPGMMMGMMGMNLTPHGLPPITPSMPPFTFLPQPSPGVPPSTTGEASSSQETSPTTGSSDSHPQITGGYPAHLHHAHSAMLSPYTPFSPGVAMSPGAFWGRPGSGVNPYINPTVGAPVHSYFPPVPPRVQAGEEGYFPPFVPTSSLTRPSGLANEIQPDQGSAEGTSTEDTLSVVHAVSDVSPSSIVTTTGTEISPRPPTPSSRGTSWRTDSDGPSPLRDVTKQMEALGIHAVVEAKDGPVPLPRSHSESAHNDSASSLEAAPMVRAESDPVQAGGAADVVGAHVHVRPGLSTAGEGVSAAQGSSPDP
jgi:hypothetical protein